MKPRSKSHCTITKLLELVYFGASKLRGLSALFTINLCGFCLGLALSIH